MELDDNEVRKKKKPKISQVELEISGRKRHYYIGKKIIKTSENKELLIGFSVDVTQNIQASKTIETPKTRAGNRKVKLLAPALEALNRQKEHTSFKGAEIFQDQRNGERWNGDQAIRKSIWRPALARAFSEMEEQGKIKKNGKEIVLLNE